MEEWTMLNSLMPQEIKAHKEDELDYLNTKQYNNCLLLGQINIL